MDLIDVEDNTIVGGKKVTLLSRHLCLKESIYLVGKGNFGLVLPVLFVFFSSCCPEHCYLSVEKVLSSAEKQMT